MVCVWGGGGAGGVLVMSGGSGCWRCYWCTACSFQRAQPTTPHRNAAYTRVLSFPVCVCVCTGVGKMMWLIDFEGYSLRNAPAVRTSLGVLHTLQVRPGCVAGCVLGVLTQGASLGGCTHCRCGGRVGSLWVWVFGTHGGKRGRLHTLQVRGPRWVAVGVGVWDTWGEAWEAAHTVGAGAALGRCGCGFGTHGGKRGRLHTLQVRGPHWVAVGVGVWDTWGEAWEAAHTAGAAALSLLGCVDKWGESMGRSRLDRHIWEGTGTLGSRVDIPNPSEFVWGRLLTGGCVGAAHAYFALTNQHNASRLHKTQPVTCRLLLLLLLLLLLVTEPLP